MLSAAENDLLTRTGAGTPMGRVMREYWIPALLSSELPAPDCDPVRVLLLGERLIAFRDSSGAVALIQNDCPHRGASLYFGRNEEGGLRCVYHGWKWDVAGKCLDMPAEPIDSTYMDKVRARTYPCIERAGIVWAYLGPRTDPPPFPLHRETGEEHGEYEAFAVQRSCNWLQAVEGELDTSHLMFLHFGAVDLQSAEPGTFFYYQLRDRRPRYSVHDTGSGVTYGAYRPAEPGYQYWRIANFLFPFYSQIPQGRLGQGPGPGLRCWVPMDDEHSMFFWLKPRDPSLFGGRGRGPLTILGDLLPNTSGWLGRFRPLADEDNDYLMDRERQRSGASYTGIEGVVTQDQAVTESMGPVYDRSREHLATSDTMVIRLRRRLGDAARALVNDGTIPPGVDDPRAYDTRSGEIVLPEDADWLSATDRLRNPTAAGAGA